MSGTPGQASRDSVPVLPLSPTVQSTAELGQLSVDELISKIKSLEQQVDQQAKKLGEFIGAAQSKQTLQETYGELKRDHRREPKPWSTTRYIALKFSYLGQRYNGYEHAGTDFTPLPTIEEVLWKALRKTRLINPHVREEADATYDVVFDRADRMRKYATPKQVGTFDGYGKKLLEISWEGCQYSKCGRTDRGVSAFGQVVGIRVRSSRPEPLQPESPASGFADEDADDLPSTASAQIVSNQEDVEFDPIRDELPYIQMLNRVLPPDIRILAWCPAPDGFDARFACKERRYKYLFTNPAFLPTPGPLGLLDGKGKPAPIREGWLDVDAMRVAAKKLEGLHDYRNLSFLDAGKQMPNCQRRILFADVDKFDYVPSQFSTNSMLNAHGQEVVGRADSSDDNTVMQAPQVYAFTVHGSAFLWHQVRCMVGVLFLIGQGLEAPEIIDDLLDIAKNPGRPHYTMADDAPLILWDTVFPTSDESPEKGLDWIYAGDQVTIEGQSSKNDTQYGPTGNIAEIWSQWQEAKIREAQTGALLDLAMRSGDGTSLIRGGYRDISSLKNRSPKVFEGTSSGRMAGPHVPLMKRPRMGTLEELNAKWLAKSDAKRPPK